MSERRALVDGLKSTAMTADPVLEKAFVFGDKKVPGADKSEATSHTVQTSANSHARVPLSTRMRADFSAALKRASLERQLSGTEPNTLQDILEQAVEPWLRNNGYLK